MTQLTIDDYLTQDLKMSVLDYLCRFHNGSNKAIHMIELADIMGCHDRMLRKVIAELKQDKTYRVKSSNKGYYIETQFDPINNRSLKRAMSSIDTAVAEDYTNLVKLYAHLNELKGKYPAVHNQIRALFIDDEVADVKRYKD